MDNSQDILALQTIVDTAVGKPKFTYPMDVNAPRPSGEYAAILKEKSCRIGYPEITIEEKTDGEGNKSLWEVTRAYRELHYNVLFSRDHDEVMLLDECPTRSDIRDLVFNLGYAIVDVYKIDNDDMTFETNWEERSACRVVLSTIRKRERRIDIVNTVEVDGSLHDGDRVYKTKQNIGGQ